MERTRVLLTCTQCGKEFERIPSMIRSTNHFCSKSCAASYNNSHFRTGENNPNYKDGSFRRSIYAKLAFRTYKPKCAVCGLEEKCCLVVHHIDHDRNHNDKENLIILCANCHSRVHYGNMELSQQVLNNREMV